MKIFKRLKIGYLFRIILYFFKVKSKFEIKFVIEPEDLGLKVVLIIISF